MSSILVTGANGQLGNAMRRVAVAKERQDIVAGKPTYFFTDVAELDITDAAAVRRFVREHRIEVIVNCAAYTNVDKAEEEGATAMLLNGHAVRNLAQACKETGAVLMHISTDYVFQGDKNLPCREEEPVNPLGVYGQTKLAGERAILESGCNYLIFRTAWLYSPWGNNFVKTMLRLTGERELLNVVFDQVGTPTHAEDLAELLVGIIEQQQYSGKNGIYHYSNEGVCSWYDFAVEIARLGGHAGCKIAPCHSNEFPSKVKRPAFSVLDKTKVKRDFGVEIPHWRTSLEKCLKEMKNINCNE